MTPTRVKYAAKPIDGERRPVTARQCWQHIAINFACALSFLLTAMLLTKTRLPLRLSLGSYSFPCMSLNLFWLILLRQIRRGEKFDTVYTLPTPELVKKRAARFKTIAIVTNGFWMPTSFALIFMMHGHHSNAAEVLLGSNILFVLTGIYLFVRADEMGKSLQAKIAPVNATLTATAQKSASEVCVPHPEESTADTLRSHGHWWTENSTRQEIIHTRH